MAPLISAFGFIFAFLGIGIVIPGLVKLLGRKPLAGIWLQAGFWMFVIAVGLWVVAANLAGII